MIHNEDTFEGHDGIKLFHQSWLPQSEPQAVIVIIHGGGDHSGRFNNVIDHLVPAGYAVHALDWRGHGRSPGIRGHINNWGELRLDLGIFINLVKKIHPSIPLFLFGHSMGGVMVLNYCLQNWDEQDNATEDGENDPLRQITGTIITSPAIGQLGISPLLWQIAKLLNKLTPSLSFPTGLDICRLTHDKEFIEYTKNDPLYHRQATPRFGMEVKKTVDFIHQKASEYSIPTILIHGTADEIASIKGSRDFVKNAANPKLEYIEYAGGYHELFNDVMKEQVLADILRWIKDQVSIYNNLVS